ncbi:hypothetical protein G6O67_000288 [Ophiocordyceps sinensis]|uniref:Uncharacterized protein n=2 Tax=Ophiocordyceps sinensis TaxID=72228 RepID=A0A8H4PYS0_9HYPO|nr:hypothetical protein OCS_05959 [Ophiocordyceps sinensis CO18]KAF4512965.1 hypothetical protein G6O67_000288 [Ophiocordyceps sinensis]
MPTRKRPQEPQGFEFDPNLQQSQKPHKRRRRQANDAPDPPVYFEHPLYVGQIAKPGPATINGAGIQHGFIKGDQPLAAPFMIPRRPEPPILIAGHSLLELGLEIPSVMGNDEAARRKRAILDELRYQRDNPPTLPPSKVRDLPPKEELPPYIEIPAGLDPESQRLIEAENNRIASLAQTIDRKRNNMAAKKSRELRVEGLNGYRKLYLETTAKHFYHRLVDVASGRDPDSWERLPENIRKDMVAVAWRAEEKVQAERNEKKKEAEARARSDKAQGKKVRHAQHAQHESESFEQTGTAIARERGEEELHVVSPADDGM